MSAHRFRSAAVLFGMSLSGAAAHAETPVAIAETSSNTVQRCVELHERARIQRVQEQWLSARQSMTECAANACPLALRVDCQDWLVELASVLPSVLIVVERGDGDTSPVELELDGESVALPVPLGPIELLPGKHRLRARTGASLPLELELDLQKGEKNRVVYLRFEYNPAPKPEPEPEPERASPPARTQTRTRLAAPMSTQRRPIPGATYWLSGGALAAFTTSGVLLGSALSSLSRARDTCAPGCEASVRRSIDGRLLAADIFGGVGVALSSIALYTFLSRPTEPTPRAAANLALTPHGARFTVESRF